MDKNESVITISLLDLWEIFRTRLVPMILAAVIAIGLLFAYSQFLVNPTYRSTATLYILKTDNDANYTSSNSDFSLALNIVNDCTYMLKSNKVLSSVINELGLSMSISSLKRCVSTSNPANTRILEVSVTTPDPNMSKQIVDKVCEIGAVEIRDAMGMDQVNLYSYGTIPSTQANRVRLRSFVLVGVAAAAAVYAVFFVIFILDDKIKSEEDVERYLGVTVLSEIPNANQSKKRGKYGRYGKYGKYSRYGAYGAYYSTYGSNMYKARQKTAADSKEGSSEKK